MESIMNWSTVITIVGILMVLTNIAVQVLKRSGAIKGIPASLCELFVKRPFFSKNPLAIQRKMM